MIAGLAMASKALNEPAYLKAAEKASDFVLNNLQQADGRLMRSFGAVPGEKLRRKSSLISMITLISFMAC